MHQNLGFYVVLIKFHFLFKCQNKMKVVVIFHKVVYLIPYQFYFVLCGLIIFQMNIQVGGESPMKQVTDLLASYQSLRSSLVKYSRQVVSIARRQLTLAERRSGEVLAETELLVNQLTRRVEQELSVQLKRVMDYKDTVLTGLSVLQNTIQGTTNFLQIKSTLCT